MNVPAFEYLPATSLAEACALLAAHAPGARVIAGGTDLLVKMKHRRLVPPYLVDLKDVPGLDHIRHDTGDGLRIGPLATIESVKQSVDVRKRYPMLHQAAACMATVPIRNRATVVGNICNGSPSAEMAPALIALGATAEIVGVDGARSALVEDFFVGPGCTILRPDEIVAELRVPEPSAGSGGIYEKYSLRRMDVALAGAAALVVPDGETCGDIRVVLSAVAPTPIRATAAERVLRGQVPTEALLAQAAAEAAAQSRPISDIRGSAEMRVKKVEELSGRAIRGALKAARLEVTR
ncbi:MAG: FAD binding domain-containing protein [Actinobacteria bacterium]|nr:FAD binding domain-containing protein [Actinomycetota bacterium]